MSILRKLSICICLSASIYFCFGADSLIVTGNVTDSATGQPILGALVAVATMGSGGPGGQQVLDSVLTDAQGTYRVNTVYPDGQGYGMIFLVATATLYQVGVEQAFIASPDDGRTDVVQQDFALAPATNPDTITVIGTVIDNNDNAVEGVSATVSAMGGMGAEVDKQTGLTDASGQFALTLIGQPILFITWEVSKNGYLSDQGFSAAQNDTVDIGSITIFPSPNGILPVEILSLRNKVEHFYVYTIDGRFVASHAGGAMDNSQLSTALAKRTGAQPLILRWRQSGKQVARKMLWLR